MSDGVSAAGHWKEPPPMERVYSAAGHWKEPCDGVGRLLKHYATFSSPIAFAIQNAEDFTTIVQSYTAIALLPLTGEQVEAFSQQKIQK